MRETIDLKREEELQQDGVPGARPARRRMDRGKLFLWCIVIIIAIAIGWWFVNGATQWKAVFLTNNQVYFGHFWDVPFEGTITLNDVYYLEFLQPGQDLNTQDQSSQLKLVKLGSEIHGPTDQMVIPVSQVLFWETLRSDSAIVTTIDNGQTQPTP